MQRLQFTISRKVLAMDLQLHPIRNTPQSAITTVHTGFTVALCSLGSGMIAKVKQPSKKYTIPIRFNDKTLDYFS